MNSKVKALLISLCAALLAAAAAFGTLAYLTDTDSVTNTFTVGKVFINLDEARVNENGVPVDTTERTEEGNNYHLIPGHRYVKDPTVTVLAGSEEAYVRMLVRVENIDQLKAALPIAGYPQYYGANDVFLLQNLVGGWDPTVWVYEGYELDGATGVYEFRYHQTVAKDADNNTVLPALFDTIELPGEDFNNDNIALLNVEGQEVKVVVIAHAIQADGFVDANAAWVAFEGTNP